MGCGALLISFSPIFVKCVVPHAMGPTAVGFYRTGLGGLALAVLARCAGASLRMRRRDMGWAALAGALFAMDLGSWHRSIPLIGSGLATLLANTQVIWVALVGAWVLRESGGWRVVASVAGSLLGVALLSGALSREGLPPLYGVGVLLGLSTGVYYAGFLLVLRRAQMQAEAPSPVVFMSWASLFTAVFLAGGVVAFSESFAVPNVASLGSVLGLALLIQALAWTLLTRAMPDLPATAGALLLLLQPTFATLWGALLFGETLTAFQAGGAALVLLAIYLGSTACRQGRPRGPEDIERIP